MTAKQIAKLCIGDLIRIRESKRGFARSIRVKSWMGIFLGVIENKKSAYRKANDMIRLLVDGDIIKFEINNIILQRVVSSIKSEP